MEFLESLRDNELIEEITTFPRGKYIDGPDALGMGKDELNKRWGSSRIPDGSSIKAFFKKRRLEKHQKKWVKEMLTPWEVS